MTRREIQRVSEIIESPRGRTDADGNIDLVHLVHADVRG